MKVTAIRQWVLATICTLAAFGSRAEEYLPFLEIGKWWIVSEKEINGEMCYHWKMLVTGSETIEEKNFFKVKITRVSMGLDKFGNDAWTEDLSPFSTLGMTFCEENGTVFRAYQNKDGGYDLTQLFSLDMEPEKGIEPIRTTVEVNGETRLGIFLHYDGSGYGDWLIEGVGPSKRFWQRMVATLGGVKRFGIYMEECHKDDILLFSREDFEALVPPVTDEIESVEADDPTRKIATFDLQGMPIAEPDRGEIYISGGKKLIAK